MNNTINNSKKYTRMIITKMRNRRIVELRNYAKLELGKSGIGQFCAKWLLQMIVQIAVFFAQNWCATKEKFCVSFHKNCAKVLRMETLLQRVEMRKLLVEKPRLKIISFQTYQHWYKFHDQTMLKTVVNRALPSLYGGSLENTLTVP